MSSPYRSIFREVDIAEIDNEDEPLAAFSVSGPKGADGLHGSQGADGAGRGADGHNGGHAGPAQRGADAGSIHVVMRTGSEDGIFVLSGQVSSHEGTHEEIRETLTMGVSGTVDLHSDGGAGGAGGNGGDGGNGARGSDGADATRHSSGSNGGSGGDGGYGGSATSGQDGGHAGSIIVELAEDDTQLLMLTRHTIAGGRGGRVGVNGSGGFGGSGGSGGSSYSWTETDYYTDSEGNQQSTTSYHSNPGGMDGPSGSSGADGRAKVHKGQNGDDGKFLILVNTEQGVERYSSRYDLALASFSHASLNADSVYEPGERIRVFDLSVRNVGGMPTPKHRDVIARLRREGWVTPEYQEKLILPRGLAAGEACTLDGELHFVIGDYIPRGPSDPLEREETLRLHGTLPAVSRDFAGFETEGSVASGQFLIRFPVRVSEIESLHSLAPGQVSRMQYKVVNQSTADLGRDSESGRMLRVTLSLHESELGPEELVFLDEEDRVHSLENGYVHEIPLLGAGESVTLQVSLGIQEGVEHYLSATTRLALELGYIDKPKKTRAIQYREFVTRVAKPYEHQEDVDLLLVVNQSTTRTELEAWRSLAADLGIGLNTLDVSLLGHLDLERSIAGRTLAEDLAGKTIVVLDSEIATSSGPLRPHELLDKGQLYAAVPRGINFAFLGPDFGLPDLLVRTDTELDSWATSPELLVSSLQEARDEHGDLLHEMDCSVVVHTRKWWWQKPEERELHERALELQTELRNGHPDRRYILVYEFAPQKQSSDVFRKRWKLGAFSIVPTLDTAAGTVVHARATGEQLHDPQYVLSDSNVLALLLTKSLDEKLVRLDKLLFRAQRPTLLGIVAPDTAAPDTAAPDTAALEAAAPDAAAPETDPAVRSASVATTERMVSLTIDAICADIANEVTAVLATRWRSGLSSEQMLRSMPLMQALSSFRFSSKYPHPPGSPGGRHLIRLAALIQFCVRSQTAFWEWVPPFLFARRSIVLRRHTERTMREFVGANFGTGAKVARRHLALAIKAETRSFRDVKKSYLGRLKRSQYARELLQGPILRGEITTDAEVLASPQSRLLDRKRFDVICENDEMAGQKRQAVVSASAGARDELLRSEASGELRT